MKTLYVLMLAFTLASSITYANKVGIYKVRACSLIVPRDTPEDVFMALMQKGFNPMNTIGNNSHVEKNLASGLVERTISPQILANREWAGVPYLELKSETKSGSKLTEASVGVVGLKQNQKYISYKTISPNEANTSAFSLDLIPDCTNEN